MKRTGFRTGFRAGRARRWVLLASALVLLEAAGPGASGGYRLAGEGFGGGWLRYRVGSQFFKPRIPWLADVWGPGDTLTWYLVDSPEWGAFAADVRQAAEEAVAAWSGIESADIRWDLEVIHPDDDRSRHAPARIVPGEGYAQSGWRGFNPVETRKASCTVGVHPGPLDGVRFVLLHELGHCLGLSHPPYFSYALPRAHREQLPPFGGPNSIMTYRGPYPHLLSLDDRIGASLLRPRPGWLAATGTLWGNVLTEDGEPASWVNVVVARVREDGRMPEAVARMTDDRGEFVIQGLDPGDYMIQARALRGDTAYWAGIRGAFVGSMADEALRHRYLRDTIRAAPVPVEAGAVAGPVTLTMRGNESWPWVSRR